MILNCRFLLCLYEADAPYERESTPSTSESSFSTLDFGGGDRSVGSSELPEFLNSFAGTIRSTPDDSPELLNSEPTHQHAREVEVLDGDAGELGEVGEQL